MDSTSWVQLISNLGFPICCCIYLFYANEKMRSTLEENTKMIESLKTLIIEHNAKYDKGD